MLISCILGEDSGLAYWERQGNKTTQLERNFLVFKNVAIDSGRTLVVIHSLAMDVAMDTSAVPQIMSGRKRKLWEPRIVSLHEVYISERQSFTYDFFNWAFPLFQTLLIFFNVKGSPIRNRKERVWFKQYCCCVLFWSFVWSVCKNFQCLQKELENTWAVLDKQSSDWFAHLILQVTFVVVEILIRQPCS